MNRNEIKAEHQRLNSKEPFTDRESKTYDKKDQSMIRNIQILNKVSKQKAINALKMYKGTPKENLRRIARNFRRKMAKAYPQNKPEVRGEVRHIKRPSKKLSEEWNFNRRKVKTYLNNPRNRTQKNYPKIEKASKKYVDASPYELRYGVNSDKSKKYRERHGFSVKYEGRIIKADTQKSKTQNVNLNKLRPPKTKAKK